MLKRCWIRSKKWPPLFFNSTNIKLKLKLMITENEIFSNQSTVKNQIVGIKYERKMNSSLGKEDISLKYIRQAKFLSVSLFLTGIFAIAGALYRWGDGSLFNAPFGTDLQLFIANIIITGPISIIAAIGFLKLRKWAIISSNFAAGIYIYSSALVYINVFQNGVPYPLKLIIPSIFGICLSTAIIVWIWKYCEVLK